MSIGASRYVGGLEMSKGAIVELSNIYLKSDRGGQVFRDLNFRLESGRSAVIVGGAGSGKSSLVEMLVGLRRPTSGSVELFGELVGSGRGRTIRRVRRKIGGVGGLFSLVPSFTVAENITYPLVIAAERKKVIKERLLKMLTEFSLLKQAGEYPDGLTRVENTLVQFARASIANQPLIVIDEPSAGLDQSTFERVLGYLVKVSLSGRSMIILASEPPPQELPSTSYYRIENGALL